MLVLGPIGFLAPAVLWGLLALPVLWWLLRAVPPAPVRRRFPGVALMLGLADRDAETARTPWWLLALRLGALGLAILGFAGPVLNPEARLPGRDPVLYVLEGSWADARDWGARTARLEALLEGSARAGQPAGVVVLTDPPAPGAPLFGAAAEAQGRVAGLRPNPWLPEGADRWAATLKGRFETVWFVSGIDWPGRAETLQALEARGPVRLIGGSAPLIALAPPVFAEGRIALGAQSLPPSGAPAEVVARGPDPNGTERDLARIELAFDAAGAAAAELALPPEIRNRIARFAVSGVQSAAAVSLGDDSLRRRKIALVSGAAAGDETLDLLAPLHYLRQALAPTADLLDGALLESLAARPDVVILADVARLGEAEAAALGAWVEGGGLLLRFAGPRLARSDVGRTEADPLLPVRLREGGRSVGGAMSWGEPRALAPFAEGTPFAGLAIPAEVTVSAQVLAQPDPDLPARTIAALADGTPLVTRAALGEGQVVLFHVTANAEWSTLPLSGLFVRMLERLAVSLRSARPDAAELEGTLWTPVQVLDAFGRPGDAGRLAAVEGARLGAALGSGATARDLPPGVYTSEDRRIALNVIGEETVLEPARWPAGTRIEGLAVPPERGLKGLALALALGLVALDALASLALAGRLRGAVAAQVGAVILGAMLLGPAAGRAQDAADAYAIRATPGFVLAHVLTGDARVDAITAQGLEGLGRVLARRTSVEPGPPVGVDLERDEIDFFTLLYWPVTADAPLPSAEAYARLGRYLRAGGMIVFDTRDDDLAAGGVATPEQARLRLLAAPLDIPPLEPVPADHVLTRTFYLLTEFPGRHPRTTVWVEAAPPEADRAEGVPFRTLNDGVTPVVIGGGDWAGAWAVDDLGLPVLPVGRGVAGERQREFAYRFGVNLVMHVLTGNYKSDQVHVPALLERLGQ